MSQYESTDGQLLAVSFSVKRFITLVLILCVQTVYAQVICHRLLAGQSKPLSNPQVSVLLNGPEGRLISVTVTDPETPHLFAKALVIKDNNKNLMQWNFVLRTPNGQRSPILRGKESVRIIMNEIEKRGIRVDRFMSDWSDTFIGFENKPSDNMIEFMKSYKKSLLKMEGSLQQPASSNDYLSGEAFQKITHAAREAAWLTWTGQQMRELGFQHLESIRLYENLDQLGPDGKVGSIEVQAFWAKEAPKFAAPLIDINSKADGSALPRFHKLINYLINP